MAPLGFDLFGILELLLRIGIAGMAAACAVVVMRRYESHPRVMPLVVGLFGFAALGVLSRLLAFIGMFGGMLWTVLWIGASVPILIGLHGLGEVSEEDDDV